jgi:hypothetical protein
MARPSSAQVAPATCMDPFFTVNEDRHSMLIRQDNNTVLEVPIYDFAAAAIVVAERRTCPACEGTIAFLDATRLPLTVRCGKCEKKFTVIYPEDTDAIDPSLLPC